MEIVKMTQLLQAAEEGRYGVGSFSARNTYLIPYILRAAQETASPVIVQISANEFRWFDVTAAEFAEQFYRVQEAFGGKAVLHLDHTKEMATIREAIAAGFGSVMIDASQLPFEENIRVTREAVAYAHAHGVEVEAELGRIGATDQIETEGDACLYTDPDEAAEFVSRTQVDTLAVSVGTAHGVYPVKDPKIDFERLREIRKKVAVPLVLHGGSGLPSETVKRAIMQEGGGVSKINIATDLEQAFLKELGCARKTNREIWELDPGALERAGLAVQRVVEDKIRNFVCSAGKLR